MKKNISLIVVRILLVAVCVVVGIVLAGVCVSCRNGSHYTIEGELPVSVFEGRMVYLSTLDQGVIVDSAVIRDGKFTFSGELEKPMMGFLQTDDEAYTSCYSIFVLEPGTIHINMASDELSGTPLNDLYYQSYTADAQGQRLRAALDKLSGESMEINDNVRRRQLVEAYDSLYSLLQQRELDIAATLFRTNKDNILGAYSLSRLVDVDAVPLDSLDFWMRSEAAYSDYEPLRKALVQMQKQANTSEGHKFVDIEGMDYATGKATRLSRMIRPGEVTLVDFWASWCGPCRDEISKNLIRLYDQYGGKGLNIIGVDVWDEPDAHRRVVEQMGIRYPQLIDTTTTAIDQYGIKGVPTILLLDKEGTIYRRDLRGDDIEKAVKELL